MDHSLDHINFRELDQKFLLVRNMDAKTRMVIEISGYHIRQDDNAFLVYGYVDPEAGITFEFLCAACFFEDGEVALEPADETKSFKIRYGSFQGDIEPFPHEDQLPPYFMKRAQSIRERYQAETDVLRMRSIPELDVSRAPGFPDDLMVIFAMDGYQPEGIWCRTLGIHEEDNGAIQSVYMQMLNEPDTPFGKHEGDVVDVTFLQNDDGAFVPVAIL